MPATLEQSLDHYVSLRRTLFYPKCDMPVSDETLRGLRQHSDESLGVSGDNISSACHEALGVAPTTIESVSPQGTFHRLFKIILLDERAVILRANVLNDTFRDYSLHLDRWVTRELRGSTIGTCKVLSVDLSRRSCPFDFELMEPAHGRVLADYEKDEDAMLQALRFLGVRLRQLHDIEMNGFGLLDISPFLNDPTAQPIGMWPSWQDYLLHRLDGHVERCREIEAISSAEADMVLQWFESSSALQNEFTPRLLHGDLGSHNVFCDDTGNTTCIVDWEDATAGDPLYEVAFWATFHPEHRWTHFLAGYKDEPTLGPDEMPRFWLYYLRVALMKAVHRHRFGYVDLPGRSPSNSRIQRALTALGALY